VGVAGVNPGVRLMNLRIGSIAGSISEDDELCAMEYAAAAGARVYNGSYSGPDASPAVADLIGAHPEVLWVFAAGNSASNNDVVPRYPCATAQPNVICVAASDNREQLGSFSNYGFNAVDLAAPGVSIGGAINTAPGNDYVYLDGTSMASPHVAGAASLIIARHPSLSVQDVKTALLQGVDQRPAYDCKTVTGGRLNVAKALAIADSIAGGNPQIPQLVPCGTPPSDSPAPSSPTAPSPDLRAPTVTLVGRNRARVPRTGRFAFSVTCNEACSFTYRVRISRVRSFNGSGSGAAGNATNVNVRPRGKARKRLLRRLRRGTVRAVVTVSARDLVGNSAPPARLTMLLRR
jgi:subtilisin family serine protease